MNKVDLKIDWCSYKAAKYAVEHWHYSGTMPVGKLAKVGAWENGQFIGCVLFSRGANRNLLGVYGLNQNQGCELTRVALNKHSTPVSRILRISTNYLKKQSDGMRVIVSYADTAQRHYGGIYQASGWVYVGSILQASTAEYNGRIAHKRTFDAAGIKGYSMLSAQKKHKYLMPLDKVMRKQIAPLAKPYPKRRLIEEQQIPSVDGGASPTSTLHIQAKANG